VSWLIGSRRAGSLALVDEHVGEPAHAAIVGDPGATHPTISPSRPDRRLSPRMPPPACLRGGDIPRSPRPARPSGSWPCHPEESIGRFVSRVHQLDPQLAEGHVIGGVEPDDDGEELEHIVARLDPGVDHR
jgi:hypothetical protein